MDSTRLLRAVPFFVGIWVLLLIVATAYHSAAAWMDADVLMNSVMSLQKVTVFYWGQNRILNVLPTAAWMFRNPAWNLGAVLVLSAAAFYGSLVMLARLIARAMELERWARYALIVALTSVAPVVLVGSGLNSLAIGHIEYALPLLLMLVAFSLLSSTAPLLARLGIAALLVFVAGGINPASCLVMLTIGAARLCWMRRAEWCSLGFAVMAGMTLGAWTVISRFFGDANYGLQDGVQWSEIMGGVQQLMQAAIGSVNVPALLILVGAVSVVIMFRQFVLGATPAPKAELVRFAYVTLIAFCAFWIFTLSVNYWVRQNLYDGRYTSYVVFAGLSALGLWFAQWDWTRWRAVGMIGLMLLMTAAGRNLAVTQLKSPHLKDFTLFKGVPQGMDPGVRLYAGNYWQVWPAVFLQLARNEVGYGLAWRGEAMTKRIRELAKRRSEGDIVEVYCLDAEESLCTHQVMGLVPSVRYVGSRIDAGATRQQYKVVAPGLNYDGAGFLALPSTTGAATPDGRATEGKPGVLFFGPYATVPAGKYRLTVRGNAQKVPGVHVEIAVHAGAQVLLSTVPQVDTPGVLIHEADVTIPDGVTDLEVRATVSADDVMTVSGYSLLPVKP